MGAQTNTLVDVLVIGAGKSGLALAYFLKDTSLRYLLVDANTHIGDSWRKRYDSLQLFTPRSFSALPGLKMAGDQEDYPTKDEIAGYLEHYAQEFALPMQLDVTVDQLTKNGDTFTVKTKNEMFTAKHVVIATGPHQTPLIPAFAKNADESVLQCHSSLYTNPTQVTPGPVLVVGAGNSGAQIAIELSDSHQVTLAAAKKIKYVPSQMFHKSIFWWANNIGYFRVTINSPVGRYLQFKGDPVVGGCIKSYIKNGRIDLKPRVSDINGANVSFSDGTTVQVKTIIWATGFCYDYSWINIPGVLGESGEPIHKRGITDVPGLYFLGLSWQHTWSSGAIFGAANDAKFLLKHILRQLS